LFITYTFTRILTLELFDFFNAEELESFTDFGIFDCDTEYSFQKSDDSDTFKDDFEAWEHVYKLAGKGNELYKRIIEFIKIFNITEYNELSKNIIQDKIKLF